ncbi:ribosomal protein S18 [Batrachochytrium salamandrivorans]|nr:ribosomal protein S18 [Batrachochytrium salamandrivorans]
MLVAATPIATRRAWLLVAKCPAAVAQPTVCQSLLNPLHLGGIAGFKRVSDETLKMETYGEDARAREPRLEGGRQVFKPKETYLPRELNDRHLEKYTKKFHLPPTEDVLKKLNIDPIKEYKASSSILDAKWSYYCSNIQMLAHFVTTIGHIKPRIETGLTPENQRKVGRAIKRARAMGNDPLFGGDI